MKDLRRELERVREQGYSSATDEVELGISSIAAPVIGPTGQALAAINLVIPSMQLEERGGFGVFVPDMLDEQGWAGSIPV